MSDLEIENENYRMARQRSEWLAYDTRLTMIGLVLGMIGGKIAAEIIWYFL